MTAPDPRHDAWDWRSAASCLGTDPDVFFTPSGPERSADAEARVTAAKAICAGCPVVAACLADAYRSHDHHAIRAGMTPEERELEARRARRRATAVRPEVSDECRAKVVELAHTGLEGVVIARRLGLHPNTVYKHVRAARKAGELPQEEPRPAPTADERCGTYAGWQTHVRRREQRCRPCLDAAAAYKGRRKAVAA